MRVYVTLDKRWNHNILYVRTVFEGGYGLHIFGGIQ